MEMLREQLSTIQHELFDCGADIAYAEKKQGKFIYKIRSEQVEQLEKWVDEHEAANAPITKFILPGGSETAAALHVCRTVCRRAERQLVTLSHQETVHVDVMKYVNRLSDYFFAAARRANMLIGVQDQEYVRSADVFGKKEQHD